MAANVQGKNTMQIQLKSITILRSPPFAKLQKKKYISIGE